MNNFDLRKFLNENKEGRQLHPNFKGPHEHYANLLPGRGMYLLQPSDIAMEIETLEAALAYLKELPASGSAE